MRTLVGVPLSAEIRERLTEARGQGKVIEGSMRGYLVLVSSNQLATITLLSCNHLATIMQLSGNYGGDRVLLE
jgi:hypothetical protein